MLPRWRPFHLAKKSGELRSLGSVRAQTEFSSAPISIEQRFAQFSSDPNIYTASDVLSALVFNPETKSHPYVDYLVDYLEKKSLIPASIRDLTSFSKKQIDEDLSLEDTDRAKQSLRVSHLKRTLLSNPKNGIAWVDLAHAHLLLGQASKAAKEIRVATALEPANRFVVRSAVRFYLSVDDPNGAFRVLNSAPNLMADPWLSAANVALCDQYDVRLKNFKELRQLLQFDTAPMNLSELASALASVDLRAGQSKRAKLLFRSALEDPTENALAQAEWSALRGVKVLHEIPVNTELAFEAMARKYLRNGDANAALKYGRLWLQDQPFALDAALFVTYVATTLTEQYDIALPAAEIGRVFAPADPLLINNHAFCLVQVGDLDKAEYLMDGRPGTTDRLVNAAITATCGLIDYRRGRIEFGRKRYREAIEVFNAESDPIGAFVALLMWSREEERSKGILSSELRQAVDHSATKLKIYSDVAIMMEREFARRENSSRHVTPGFRLKFS